MLNRFALIIVVAFSLQSIAAAPNPSAVYCQEMGYRLEGEVCRFPDGSACEYWHFFRGECGNPWSYCEQNGGRVGPQEETNDAWTGKYALCIFPDGSECGEQAYMTGECDPSECTLWGISGCADAIDPEERTIRLQGGIIDEDERARTPTSKHVPFGCSYFKRTNPPLTRQVLAPGDLLTIDLCAGEQLGCDWDDQAEIGNPFVLHQSEHKDLDKDKLKLRFSPVERYIFPIGSPGNSLITFTCRGDGVEVVRTHIAAVTSDPAAVSVSISEDTVQVLKPDGEVVNFTPDSSFMPYFLKCKTLRKAKKPIDKIYARQFDRFEFFLCAADWLECTWRDQAQVSDTGVVLQYQHKHVPDPALRRNPEDRYRFQTIGEGSSEVAFSCVDEEGQEVRTHRVTLTVGEERWAEIIPFKPKDENEEEGTTVASQPLCLMDTDDPCRHCSHFDRLDYMYVKESGGGLTLVPTEAKVLRDWKYMDDACDPPIETDLSDHYPLLVKYAIGGPRAPADRKEITLLNYNAHAFAGLKGVIAEATSKKVMLYQDYQRLDHIAARILDLDPDIVGMQEVWGGVEQMAFGVSLRKRYPYIYAGPGSDGLRMSSGVLVFSKLPLKNVQTRAFPITLPIVAGIPTSTRMQDAWARKGVVTADVVLESGASFRLGVSHALTDQNVGKGKWSKFYRENAITPFALNGDPLLFALKDWTFDEAVIARLYDYSWDYGGERHYDAGWKITDVSKWSAAYEAIVSFELKGHPYLFALKGKNFVGVPFHRAYIRRINDDGSGWTDVWNDRWSSFYKGSAFTSFQLNGHPHIFGLKTEGNNKGKALIVRIKDDGNGYENSVWGEWGLGSSQNVVPFEINGRPYLFETRGRNVRIARIDFDRSTDQVTGWTYVYESPLSEIPSNCFGPGAAGNARDGIAVERIHSDKWGNDFFVSRAFQMSGHPHLFSLKSMRGEAWMDLFETLPGEGYLTRIDDDGRGWQHLINLPQIQMIIDETIRDDRAAVMMGDFNVHWDHYGNMNRMFETFGAADAWPIVHGNDMQGAETIDACDNTLTQVFGQKPDWLSPCLDRIPPILNTTEEKKPEDLCGLPYDRGEVTSVTAFELNGQPHIFVLTEKKRGGLGLDTKNVADIYRIHGGSVGNERP